MSILFRRDGRRDPDRKLHPDRRRLAPWIFLLATLVAVFTYGIPSGTDVLYLWALVGLFCFSLADVRGFFRGITRDWLPFIVILVAYDSLRGSAGRLFAVHFLPQIQVDRWMFGGQVPTVTLQRALWDGHAVWWDVIPWAVYTSHFIFTPLLAAILWKRNRERFVWFKRRVIALSFAGLATYAVYPAAPPWLASQDHFIAPIQRLIPQFATILPIHGAGALFETGEAYSNNVAAVPSLHAAFSVLISCAVWPFTPRWLKPMLILYPAAMAFAVVFSGEHYVSDVLLGWIYTGGTLLGFRLAVRFRAVRAARQEYPAREREGAPALADSAM